ncbi:hypothetical protein M3Y97_01054700 [Aphelenchoides bicaudatus]|nr:hypothetical protein M3Y97_01054700 [Aphelenchoides bicaudatus]
MKGIFVAITFLLAAHSIYALKCRFCDEINANHTCTNNKYMACKFGTWSCVKLVRQSDKKAIKACAENDFKEFDRQKAQCVKMNHTQYGEVEACNCRSQLCNSSSKQSFATFLLSGSVILIGLILFC